VVALVLVSVLVGDGKWELVWEVRLALEGGSCGFGVGVGGSIGKDGGGRIFLPPSPPSDLIATSTNIL
jgi:hypothetical protein